MIRLSLSNTYNIFYLHVYILMIKSLWRKYVTAWICKMVPFTCEQIKCYNSRLLMLSRLLLYQNIARYTVASLMKISDSYMQ